MKGINLNVPKVTSTSVPTDEGALSLPVAQVVAVRQAVPMRNGIVTANPIEAPQEDLPPQVTNPSVENDTDGIVTGDTGSKFAARCREDTPARRLLLSLFLLSNYLGMAYWLPITFLGSDQPMIVVVAVVLCVVALTGMFVVPRLLMITTGGFGDGCFVDFTRFGCYGIGWLMTVITAYLVAYYVILMNMEHVEGLSVMEVGDHPGAEAFYFTDGSVAYDWTEKSKEKICKETNSQKSTSKTVCTDYYYAQAPVFANGSSSCYTAGDGVNTTSPCGTPFMATTSSSATAADIATNGHCSRNKYGGLCAYESIGWEDSWDNLAMRKLCQSIIGHHNLTAVPLDLCSSQHPLTIGDYHEDAQDALKAAQSMCIGPVLAFLSALGATTYEACCAS